MRTIQRINGHACIATNYRCGRCLKREKCKQYFRHFYKREITALFVVGAVVLLTLFYFVLLVS